MGGNVAGNALQMGETQVQRHTEAVAANLASHASHAKADLDQHGLVSLRGIIAAEWLAAARGEVDAYLARYGRREHNLTNADSWECPTIEALADHLRIETFLHSLTSLPESAEFGYAGYQQRVLRILDGSNVETPPFDWHYDSNALTMLVPIVVPADGTGQVAIFPDHRPHRRWAALSAAERLLVHNQMHGRRMRQRYEDDPTAFTIPLVPGDAYLFRGYRALHSVLPWSKDTLRVTLVLQYGRPYGAEGPVIRAVRRWRDTKRKRRTTDLLAHNRAL
ncbi:hypothetical protein MGALJ_57560 [Mycobacterium gallinarum]|uniref:Uncharacterized protein n=2 Tax=Mycobacterium gallinarum TaxID=39689 RepID=A0A9W4FI75_9MYCO|nr:hypothetical protein MGALJ_57560 [Mycobacterium gallinarum]